MPGGIPRKLRSAADRLRRSGGEAAWILVGQLGVVTGSLVLVRVLTDFLTPAQYGLLALAMTGFSFGQTVVFGALSSSVLRFYSIARDQGLMPAYMQIVRSAALGLAGLWTGGLSLLGVVLWWMGYRDAAILAVLVIPASVFSGVSSALNSLQNASRNRPLVAMHQAADAWLKVGVVLILAAFFPPDVRHVLVAYAVAALAVLASLSLHHRRTARAAAAHPEQSPISVGELKGQMRDYAGPFYIWGPLTWAQQSADRWSLQAFGTPGAVGAYALVIQLTFAPMRQLVTTFSRIFAPVLFGRVGASARSQRAQSAFRLLWGLTGTALLGTLVLFALGLLFREEIFSVLVGPEFRSNSIYFPWLLLAAGFYATGQLATLRILSETASHLLIAPKVVSALVGIGLSFAGAWYAGIWGAVVAQLAFSMLQLVWLVSQAARLSR